MGSGDGDTEGQNHEELIHGALRELGHCFEKTELRNILCPKEKVKEFHGAKLRTEQQRPGIGSCTELYVDLVQGSEAKTENCHVFSRI